MTLYQEGNLVWGSYPYSGGKIIGSLDGDRIYGYWWESDDATGCGPDKAWRGPPLFVLSADGSSFAGAYDKASPGRHGGSRPDGLVDVERQARLGADHQDALAEAQRVQDTGW